MPAGGERVERAPSAGGEGKCVRRGSPPSAHSLWSKHQLRRGKEEGKKNLRKLPSRKCSSRVCLSPELPPAGEELRLIADADRPDPGNSHHFSIPQVQRKRTFLGLFETTGSHGTLFGPPSWFWGAGAGCPRAGSLAGRKAGRCLGTWTGPGGTPRCSPGRLLG